MRSSCGVRRCHICDNVLTADKWGHHIYHCVRDARTAKAKAVRA